MNINGKFRNKVSKFEFRAHCALWQSQSKSLLLFSTHSFPSCFSLNFSWKWPTFTPYTSAQVFWLQWMWTHRPWNGVPAPQSSRIRHLKIFRRLHRVITTTTPPVHRHTLIERKRMWKTLWPPQHPLEQWTGERECFGRTSPYLPWWSSEQIY